MVINIQTNHILQALFQLVSSRQYLFDNQYIINENTIYHPITESRIVSNLFQGRIKETANCMVNRH